MRASAASPVVHFCMLRAILQLSPLLDEAPGELQGSPASPHQSSPVGSSLPEKTLLLPRWGREDASLFASQEGNTPGW